LPKATASHPRVKDKTIESKRSLHLTSEDFLDKTASNRFLGSDSDLSLPVSPIPLQVPSDIFEWNKKLSNGPREMFGQALTDSIKRPAGKRLVQRILELHHTPGVAIPCNAQ
jgi:hypothetical protein